MIPVSLHTAEVKAGDIQTTHEAAFDGYKRVALTTERIMFPVCTDDVPVRITHLAQGDGSRITKVIPLKPTILTQKNFGIVLEGKDFQ